MLEPSSIARRLRLAVLADAAHVNCQRWCEGLQHAGAEVHIISFADWATKSFTLHRLPIGPWPGKLHYFAAACYTRRLLAKIRPDVLLAYYVTGYGTLAALSGFHPVVQVTSGSDVLEAPGFPTLRAILRQTLKRADLVTAWESHMAEAVQTLGVPSARLFVLPRGIPYRHFAQHRAPVPDTRKSISIISTRSLGPAYNVDRLVRAAAILSQQGIDLSLTIAGDGPCRAELVLLAQELGIKEKISFSGFVSNDQLGSLLAQHNFYISLIAYDGVSASLLEAMAVGLLPMVPDHEANRLWIKDGENGVLLKDLSPEGIARAIGRALSNQELRESAWKHNAQLIRERGDLAVNSRLYMEEFRRLAQLGFQLQTAAP